MKKLPAIATALEMMPPYTSAHIVGVTIAHMMCIIIVDTATNMS